MIRYLTQGTYCTVRLTPGLGSLGPIIIQFEREEKEERKER